MELPPDRPQMLRRHKGLLCIYRSFSATRTSGCITLINPRLRLSACEESIGPITAKKVTKIEYIALIIKSI